MFLHFLDRTVKSDGLCVVVPILAVVVAPILLPLIQVCTFYEHPEV